MTAMRANAGASGTTHGVPGGTTASDASTDPGLASGSAFEIGETVSRSSVLAYGINFSFCPGPSI